MAVVRDAAKNYPMIEIHHASVACKQFRPRLAEATS